LQGDECLRELAQLCATHVRDGSDLAARYGGEEIVILLPRCGMDEAMRVAETLRGQVEALALPHPDSPAGDCVTVSIGVAAACPRDTQASPDALVAAADAAMYAAKARGRNCVEAQATLRV
jgi:diguanylate cyclase (GGDEF)-like protein